MKPSNDLVHRALKSDRTTFTTTCPYFFLLGRDAFHRPNRPDATAQFSSFDEEVTTISSVPEKLDSSAAPSWLALPLVKSQSIHPDMITVGRTANNDITLPDITVSKFHAYFRVPSSGLQLAAGGVDVCDAKSNNGTFIARRRLAPLETMFAPVGSSVRFGNVTLSLLDAGRLWDALRAEHRP